jgi:hypothetical protein
MDFASWQHHLPSSSIPQPRRQADVMLPECVVKAPCPDPESGVPAAYRILASEITWSFSTEKHRKTQLDLPMVVVFRYFQTLGFTWAKCLVCRASHGKNRCATPTVARIISCFSPLLSDSANVYISIYINIIYIYHIVFHVVNLWHINIRHVVSCCLPNGILWIRPHPTHSEDTPATCSAP